MSSDAENVIRKYTCQQYIYQFVIWEYMYDLGFVGLLTRNCWFVSYDFVLNQNLRRSFMMNGIIWEECCSWSMHGEMLGHFAPNNNNWNIERHIGLNFNCDWYKVDY